MDFNVIFTEFKEKNGKFKDENKFQGILKEMGLKNISSLFTFQNAEKEEMNIDSTNAIDNFQARKYYEELNLAMFGDYLIKASKISSTNLRDKLTTSMDSINQFLSGGFQRAKIYELQGPSLCGKSHFIKSLIQNNLNNISKILIIDTNSSFCFENFAIKSKINHIQNIFDFNELFNFLSRLYKTYEIQEYSFIIIDSLSLIANKLILLKEDELIKEFNNLIISIVAKFSLGIIYTSTAYKVREKTLYDFKNYETLLSKEIETNLHGNVILLPDYTLLFMNPNYSLTLTGIKNRKYLVKIKKEKGHPIDKLIEL